MKSIIAAIVLLFAGQAHALVVARCEPFNDPAYGQPQFGFKITFSNVDAKDGDNALKPAVTLKFTSLDAGVVVKEYESHGSWECREDNAFPNRKTYLNPCRTNRTLEYVAVVRLSAPGALAVKAGSAKTLICK